MGKAADISNEDDKVPVKAADISNEDYKVPVKVADISNQEMKVSAKSNVTPEKKSHEVENKVCPSNTDIPRLPASRSDVLARINEKKADDKALVKAADISNEDDKVPVKAADISKQKMKVPVKAADISKPEMKVPAKFNVTPEKKSHEVETKVYPSSPDVSTRTNGKKADDKALVKATDISKDDDKAPVKAADISKQEMKVPAKSNDTPEKKSHKVDTKIFPSNSDIPSPPTKKSDVSTNTPDKSKHL